MRMDELLLKKGSEIVFGAPATQAISAQAVAAIGKAVATIREIQEAHLPQCFAEGISEAPSQVLVLVLARSAAPGNVMHRLGPQLHKIIPKGVYLDVLPIGPAHQFVDAVRRAGCQIYRAPNRPWWRFW
jgi:hypothetical protein